MQALVRLVSVLIVAAIAAVLSVATIQLVARTTEGVAEPRAEERVRTTEASALALRGWFNRSAAEVALTAAQLADAPLDSRATDQLGALVERSPVLEHAYVADADGRVTAASTSATGLVGLARPSPHHGAALATGQAVSGVTADGLLREPAIEFAVGIGEPAHAVLVGIAPLGGGGLAARLAELPVPSTARVGAVGPDGTVARPGPQPESPERAGPNLALPAEEAAAGPGLVEYDGEAGVPTVAAYAPITNGWLLVIYEDAAAFTPAGVGARAALAAAPGLAALGALLVIGFVVLDTRARRRAAEAEEAKHAFLAVTGHELRTPLTVLSGMVETLDRGGERLGPEFREQAIRTMAVQVRKLDLLIERLIFVSHLESGIGISVQVSKLDIAPLLERVVEEQRTAWPLHTFTTEVESPLEAMADPGALRQVLRHLLENAARYSPAGGEIRLTASRAGRKVEVTVEDEGVGLPADTSRIFDKFVQGETVDTRVRDEGGVGLGLYVVKTLTEAMSGVARAESRRQGTAFVLTLVGATSQK